MTKGNCTSTLVRRRLILRVQSNLQKLFRTKTKHEVQVNLARDRPCARCNLRRDCSASLS